MSRLRQLLDLVWSQGTDPQLPLVVAQWMQEATREIEYMQTTIEGIQQRLEQLQATLDDSDDRKEGAT